MNMQQVIVVRVGELALKGKNRHVFEKRLVENIALAVRDRWSVRIQREYGRVAISPRDTNTFPDADELITVLRQVFGIANVSLSMRVEAQKYEELERAVMTMLHKNTPNGSSFAVRVRRSDKQFPVQSEECNRRLGAVIAEQYGWKVDLQQPDITIRADITDSGVFVSSQKFSGAGGLPVTMSGRVMVLLSSGIDSPVAAHMMMKRGALPIYIHFHSYPLTSRASIDNAIDLATQLHTHQPGTRLLLAPLAEAQKQIVAQAPSRFRVLLYRRLMYQAAERLAQEYSAGALVTGESLGQVASQTMENMQVTHHGISLPIFRPLIGFDKQEIMDYARTIETYDISIREYEDCCSLLVPKSVETKGRIEDILEIEKTLPWNDLIESVVQNVQMERV